MVENQNNLSSILLAHKTRLVFGIVAGLCLMAVIVNPNHVLAETQALDANEPQSENVFVPAGAGTETSGVNQSAENSSNSTGALIIIASASVIAGILSWIIISKASKSSGSPDLTTYANNPLPDNPAADNGYQNAPANYSVQAPAQQNIEPAYQQSYEHNPPQPNTATPHMEIKSSAHVAAQNQTDTGQPPSVPELSHPNSHASAQPEAKPNDPYSPGEVISPAALSTESTHSNYP